MKDIVGRTNGEVAAMALDAHDHVQDHFGMEHFKEQVREAVFPGKQD